MPQGSWTHFSSIHRHELLHGCVPTYTDRLLGGVDRRVFWRALAMGRTSFEKRLLRSSCGVNGNHLVCCSHWFEFVTVAVGSSNVGKKMTP